MTTLVIRFSSVGDIVLCGAVTGALEPVIFVTNPAYRTLAAALPGVVKVICPPQDELPKQVDKIVDLHSNWRSFSVRRKVKGPVYSIDRHDLRRRFRVWLKIGKPPPPVISRYAKAAGVDEVSKEWAMPQTGPNNALAIIPFCRHRTKEWPLLKYAEIGKRYNGPVLILGSPKEKEKMDPLLHAIGSKARPLAFDGFKEIFDAMAEIRIAVGGDTGLAHLCAAYHKPVVTLFGPTTKADGFWHDAANTVSVDLSCRPCSRFGSSNCPMGDHLCMKNITVDEVWRQIEAAIS